MLKFHSIMSRTVVRAWVFTTVACSRQLPEATPEGAVRLWVDTMEVAIEDPSKMRQVFQVLGPAARAHLEERALRVSQFQGRRMEGWQMLAPGRFGLKFRPKAMKAVTSDTQAMVQVTGSDPVTEQAEVRCVREGAAWRVEPEFPALIPLSKRDGK